MKENPHWKICGDRRQVQQHDQDKESGLGLAGYVTWKLATKLET